MKRRKPDVLVILAVAAGLGVLVTGYAQGLFHSDPARELLQQMSDNARKVGDFAERDLTVRRDGVARPVRDSL